MAERVTLLEFIFAYIDNVQNLNQYIKSLANGQQSTYAYFLLQASEYYPNFLEKYTELYELERKGWEINIKAAIERKEIKEDIDIQTLTTQFQSLYFGVLLQSGLVPQRFTTTTLQSLMISLYNDIKVRQEKVCFALGKR